MEALLAIGLLLAATLAGIWLLARSPSGRTARLPFAVSMLALGAVGVLAANRLHRPPPAEPDVAERPIEVATAGYATSGSCRSCHPGQYASWDSSYHSSMTQVAGTDTVLGDFEDRRLMIGEHEFVLSRRGDEFWVDMPDLDFDPGVRVQRRIVLTTGSHHMQVYWYGADNTRVLGLLPFVHNVELDDWFPRDASFIRPPHEQLSSERGRWNKTCLECHVVLGRLRPVENDGLGGHDTHVAEFGISCGSCHGPGEAHVAANGNALTRYTTRFSDEPPGDIVQPERLDHRRSAEVCGQCHSTSLWTSQEAIDAFMQNGFEYRPGDVLADSKSVVRGKMEWNPPEVREGLSIQPEFLANTFWSDGMNRITGREYNGLIETACFIDGEMSCLSCHQMHHDPEDPRPVEEWADDQLKPGMRGNAACTQCHGEFEQSQAIEAHTHHASGSSGSVCYNCHMPHTTYGLLNAVRSHQIDSPSVRAGLETRRPVACNQCHLDRTLAWTAGHLQTWYGIETPELSPLHELVAAVPLMALNGDAGERALAAWSMSWPPALAIAGEDWEGLYLGVLLNDPYPAVRHIASRSLRRLPGFEDFEYDAMAPQTALQDKGNEALQQWAARHAQLRTSFKAELLIDYDGPRMQALLQLLKGRDDRPVMFAE